MQLVGPGPWRETSHFNSDFSCIAHGHSLHGHGPLPRILSRCKTKLLTPSQIPQVLQK